MSRFELIRLFYRGGQAAIAAELCVILGIFWAVLSQGQTLVTSNDLQALFTATERMGREQPLGFISSFSLILLIPSFLMLWVVWTWHVYFQTQGYVVFHWFATSIALIGLTLILISYFLTLFGTFAFIDGLDKGYLQYETGYALLLIVVTLDIFGIGLVYWLYTVLIVLAVLAERQLTRPTIFLGTLLFILFNGFAFAFSPFIMGALMLNHVNILAKEAGISTT